MSLTYTKIYIRTHTYKHTHTHPGCTTSGGTESIILAIKAHRDFYRDQRGIAYPEMVACTSAHAAVDKACDLLGIKQVQVSDIDLKGAIPLGGWSVIGY